MENLICSHNCRNRKRAVQTIPGYCYMLARGTMMERKFVLWNGNAVINVSLVALLETDVFDISVLHTWLTECELVLCVSESMQYMLLRTTKPGLFSFYHHITSIVIIVASLSLSPLSHFLLQQKFNTFYFTAFYGWLCAICSKEN